MPELLRQGDALRGRYTCGSCAVVGECALSCMSTIPSVVNCVVSRNFCVLMLVML